MCRRIQKGYYLKKGTCRQHFSIKHHATQINTWLTSMLMISSRVLRYRRSGNSTNVIRSRYSQAFQGRDTMEIWSCFVVNPVMWRTVVAKWFTEKRTGFWETRHLYYVVSRPRDSNESNCTLLHFALNQNNIRHCFKHAL